MSSLPTIPLLIALALGPSGGPSPAPEPAPSQPTPAAVELAWSCGRAARTPCSLAVGLNPATGESAAAWHCLSSSPPRELLYRRATIDNDQARELLALVNAAQLFEARHIGSDPRATDACLTTLRLSQTGRAVALVTSGNPVFEVDGPARKLVEEEIMLLQRTMYREWVAEHSDPE